MGERLGPRILLYIPTCLYECLFIFNTEDIGLTLVGRHDLLKEHDTETQPQLQEGAWRGSWETLAGEPDLFLLTQESSPAL